MVLWEITLATAYFLGLRRTYGLALKAQRRLVSPKRPKLRLFLHRRTRAVFDVALKVHNNIQESDIKVCPNLRNQILQWADRMRPSAQISGQQFPKLPTISVPKMNTSKQVLSMKAKSLRIPTISLPKMNMSKQVLSTKAKSLRIIQTSRNLWSNPFSAISIMMQQQRHAGRMTQSRYLFIRASQVASSGFIHRARGSGGVLRSDIRQYLHLKGP